MVFIVAVAELHAFQKLVGDIRIAGGGGERGEPIETGEDSVFDRARLNVPRPAGDAGNAEAPFHDGAFGGA